MYDGINKPTLGFVVLGLVLASIAIVCLCVVFSGKWEHERLKPFIKNMLSFYDSIWGSGRLKERIKIIRRARICIFVLHLLVLAYFIITVEVTLVWNGVTGINSMAQTGQLIPLVTGCTSMVQVVWGCALKARQELSGATDQHDKAEEPAHGDYELQSPRSQSRDDGDEILPDTMESHDKPPSEIEAGNSECMKFGATPVPENPPVGRT